MTIQRITRACSLFVMTMLVPHISHAGANVGLDNVANEAGYGGRVGEGLPQIIANIISTALGLLGIIFLILILYAGFTWMTAGGNTERVDTAKTILRNAIIGIIVILAGYAITNFVVSIAIQTSGVSG